MKRLIVLILLSFTSCVDTQRIEDSLSVMDSLVTNMNRNDELLVDAYLRQLESLILIIDANRDAKIKILNEESPTNSEESAFLSERIRKIHEIASKQKELVRKKIAFVESKVDLGRKNYDDYTKISEDLDHYLKTLKKTDPEQLLGE